VIGTSENLKGSEQNSRTAAISTAGQVEVHESVQKSTGCD
jgi:hypothetical protein